jgi:Zn-dependent protease with chaperone function
MLAQFGIGLFLNAYSRHEEKEADLYAAHIMFNAGWNPTAMSLTFLKMYKLHPKQPVKFLSTHPPIQDRADYLTESKKVCHEKSINSFSRSNFCNNGLTDR